MTSKWLDIRKAKYFFFAFLLSRSTLADNNDVVKISSHQFNLFPSLVCVS